MEKADELKHTGAEGENKQTNPLFNCIPLVWCLLGVPTKQKWLNTADSSCWRLTAYGLLTRMCQPKTLNQQQSEIQRREGGFTPVISKQKAARDLHFK